MCYSVRSKRIVILQPFILHHWLYSTDLGLLTLVYFQRESIKKCLFSYHLGQVAQCSAPITKTQQIRGSNCVLRFNHSTFYSSRIDEMNNKLDWEIKIAGSALRCTTSVTYALKHPGAHEKKHCCTIQVIILNKFQNTMFSFSFKMK